MKIKRLSVLFSISFLFVTGSLAQPIWVPTTPSIGTVGPTTIPINYGIDRIGTVYIIVWNFNNPLSYTSAGVKSLASGAPIGQLVATAVIPVNAGNINLLLQRIFDVVNANTTHTIYIVAADGSGILQANPIRLVCTTLPCPKIDILTGFTQPVLCVNKGATAVFQSVILDPPNSGILKGTTWFIDWGDGTSLTYTSTADYDVPPVATRTHTYSTVTSCNYVFTNSIKNPCGETRSVQYIAVVHGRDIPSDGDGILQLVNDAGGSTVIQVCAGVQSLITIRDNSTWNCQNPVLPGGFTPVPNLDPRNIEWLYGRDPLGAITNTITGTVSIAVLGNAPKASGRITPSPYGPASLSQTITIPATCVAGQYFRVYMKEWNKCNWTDPEYVNTYVDINVIAVPPAPNASSRTICFGDDRTLTVSTVPVGTLTWYSDAALTTAVGTGSAFVPSQTAVGSYNFWVVDRSNTGLTCQSPSTPVTLTINPIPNKPTVTLTGLASFCFDGGITTVKLTANPNTPPAITSYQWYKNGTAVGGAVTNSITLSQPSENGNYTVRTFGINTTNCPSPLSDPVTITIYSLTNIVHPTNKTVCELGSTTFTASTTDAIQKWQWEVSTDGGTTWGNANNGLYYSGFNSNSLTVLNIPLTFNGNRYRVQVTTTAGGCIYYTNSALLTVNAIPVPTIAGNSSVCTGAAGNVYTTQGGMTNYLWTVSAGGTITSGGGTGSNTVTVTWNTAGARTVSVNYTNGSGCTAVNPTVYNVTVNARPAPVIAGPAAACIGSTGNLYSTAAGMTNYVWTVSAGGTITAGGGAGNSSVTITWTATGAQTVSVNYNNAAGCPATSPTVYNVTVNPLPAPAIAGNTSVCVSAAGNVYTTQAGMTNYLWTVSAGGNITAGGGTANNTVTVTWTTTGAKTVTVNYTNGNGCTAASPTTLNVTVNARPAPTIAGPASVCVGATGNVYTTQAGMSNYSWTVSAGGTITAGGGNNTVTVTWNTAGAQTVSVNYNNASGCPALIPTVYNVTVNPLPVPTITGPAAVCINSPGNVYTSEAGMTNYIWTISAGGTITAGGGAANNSVTVTWTTAGARTVSVKYTNGNGCTAAVPTVYNVAVGTLPTAATLSGSSDACVGTVSSMVSVITGGGPPYTVNYTRNGVAQPVINNYTSGTNYSLGSLPLGSYSYIITSVQDLCGNFVPGGALPGPYTITIYPIPSAVATLNNTAVICNNGTTDIVLHSDVANSDFIWTVSNAPATTWTGGKAPAGGTRVSGENYSIAQNLEHNGTQPITVTYSITPRGPGATACLGAVITRSVVVNPAGQVTQPANQVLCNGTNTSLVTFGTTNTGGATTYSWTNSTTSIGLAASGTGNIAAFAASNNGTSPVTATIVVTPTFTNGSVSCPGTTKTFTITVNPAAQVDLPTNQIVCNNTATALVSFTTDRTGGSTTYSWTNNTISIGLAASGTGNIASFTAVNATTAPVTATVVVTPTFTNALVSCTGPTKSFTIIVNPTGQVTQPANQTVCTGTNIAAVTFGTTNTGGVTTYAWTNNTPSIGLAASGTGNISAFSAVNPGTAPVTATIVVTPTFTNGSLGCQGATKSFTITVNPGGQVNQPANQVVCHNSLTAAVTFGTANTGGITTYSWTNNTTSIGLAASGSGGAIAAFTATTISTAPVIATIVVTPTFTIGGVSCTGSTKTFTITVNPTAQVNQPGNQVLCNGATTTLVTFGTLNTGGATTYSWTNNITSIGLPASGTGDITAFTAVNAGTAPVVATITATPTFTNGGISCTGPAKSFTITVNPTPSLSSTLTPAALCSNTPFNYIPLSATTGTTFSWTRAVVTGITPVGPVSGSNNANETLINITSAAIAVTYAYTLQANGCSNSQNVIVSIKPEPVISVQSTSVCSGVSMNYRILLDNFTNPPDGVTFTWLAPSLSAGITGGSGRGSASSSNITDTFINTSGGIGTATYHIIPYLNGCSGTAKDIVVTIGSQPVLDPGLNKTVCSNAATGLILKEAAGSVVPTHYNIISIIVDPGLSSAPSNAVIPNATASSGYLSADKFTNMTGVNKNVTYRIQPVLAPDCFGNPVNVAITVRPQPVVLPGQTKTVCSRTPIGKEIILVPANIPAGTIFNWGVPVMSDASGQGTAGVNVAADPSGSLHINDIIHNYSSAPITATYTITPTSQNGCAGTAVPLIITINKEPVPQPVSGRVNLCAGEKNIVYGVNPVGGSTFHWTVDPAVGSKTFDFNTNVILVDAAASSGTGNITVFETNSLGCSGDLSTLAVHVFTQPAPENIIGAAVVCALSTHAYSVTNRAGSVYSWTVPGGTAIIGDPSASSISVVFGITGGTILARETNIAGCITNHNPLSVTVNPLPTATISNGGTMCDGGTRPLNVAFIGTAPFSFTYAINGVPQTPVSTSSNPYTINANLAGTYTIVNVTDNTGCTNTGSGTATITYFPKPTGIISGNAQMCRGSSATLTMTFTGVAPFTFTYTDGTTPVTVAAHPSNVYTINVSPLISSTYTITALTDFNNCSGALSGSAVIAVNQLPSLSITGTNLICYNVNTGAVDLTITGGTFPFGIAWTGPDGFTAPLEDISGLKAGYYAVTVTDSKGCSASGNITLTQPPVLNGTLGGTNITCFGANDGSITISGATGGAGTYQYTINGGSSWGGSGTFTNLAPGTYDVKIRDAINTTCILTLNSSMVLTGPAVLNATVTKTDISCFGANNGSIVISGATGGYGTFQYTINGGTTWLGSGTFTNLGPGSYNVRIRDAVNTGCVVILNPVSITEPPVISATVTRTNISCFGSSDGTILITAPTGGHGTYEYSINGGGSWQAGGSFTGLAPGSHNVQIRDGAYTGCYIVLNSALVITQPAVLNASLTSVNVTCNGSNDGSISITGASGGYGTYQYTINGGTTWLASGLFSGVAPGTYDVRVRDAANPACMIILNAGLQITEPAALTALVIDTDITCAGANDGVISITNSAGGYGTYQYSVNGGTTWQNTAVFSPLTPGSYNVRIRDRAHTGCAVILNPAVQITEPTVLIAVVSPTNVTCNASNDGTIIISSPSGGYGSYSYSVNGGTSWQGSGSFTNLAPGTYNVRLRDAINTSCVIILNPAVIITQPVVISAAVVRTNVTCYGAEDGTITISGASGGYGTYDYTIDGGATWLSTGNFTSLKPGYYNVKIRDAAHPSCIITLNGSLSITEPAVLSANVAGTNITCNGANDGTITISSQLGGYGTYSYSINGGGSWQSSGTFTGLGAGTYDVQIRDAAHAVCVITLNSALVITEPLPLGATLTPIMISCFGANNGIIAITSPSGGSGNYEYTVNGGTTWVGLGNFTGLIPGTYNVRMRDAVHPACVLSLNASLPITQPAVLHADITRTNVTCFGTSDGTITLSNPAGGYGTYEYTVNGGGAWQASGSFTGLGPGTYNVQIRDAGHSSCIIVLNNAQVITQPAILKATVTSSMITCNGAHDGIISITAPSGGSGTFEYSINGGTSWQASGTFAGLIPATYDIRIRDAAHIGCEIGLNPGLTITEPAVLNATLAGRAVTCNGSTDGQIEIIGPTGGYGTFEYSINGGTTWQGTGIFSSLAPGNYDVRIRDKAHAGCAVILNPSLSITQPAPLSALASGTNVSCNGANDGQINITGAAGGSGNYQFAINGGAAWQTSGTFNFLTAGPYNVRIRDAANITCESVLNPVLTLTQPSKLAAAVAGTNISCSGSNDGTITISSPTGGYGTYGYSVDGGISWQAGGNFATLPPGFYNVQIRDAAHTACVVVLNGSFRITEPPVLSANVTRTNITCNGAANGVIAITSPAGGYGTYQYSINGGIAWQASGNFPGLPPGTYDVRIRDAAHIACLIILDPALTVTQPAVLNASVNSFNVTCFGANDGSISVTGATGGSGSYQYSVNGGTTWQGFGSFANLAPGSYNVRIRDAASIACTITLNPSVAVTQPAILSANISGSNVTCFGGNDGSINITGAAGGYGTYDYSVNGGGSWQPSGSFNGLTPGSYNVLIRDAGHTGCIIVLNNSFIISQPVLLSATVSKTDVSCHGNNDGSISVSSPSGGNGTYEYSSNGGTSWQSSGSFINLAPGTYDIRIRDAAHSACWAILYPNLVITEPLTLSVSTSGNVILDCNGDMDGMGTFFALGGTMPYSFLVVSNTTGGTVASPGFNSQTFFNAGAGSITVRAVDINGCSSQATISLIQPPVLTPGSITASQVVCFGSNPAILTENLAPLGGPGSYLFQWQSSTNIAGPFINIAGATSNSYTPPAGASYTLYYRRMVHSGVCSSVYSNVVEILVNPVPIAFLTGGETICPGQSSILNVNLPSGTGPFTLDIENLGTVTGYTSGTNIIVTPVSTTAYRLLRVRDANNCEVVSPSANLNGTATVVVSALPLITTFTPSPAVCEFTLAKFTVAATGTNMNYQWYVNQGSGFNPASDGGTYFGALTPVLQIFNSVRAMNGFIYHVVISGCGNSVTSADAVFTVNIAPEITLHPQDSTVCLGQNAILKADGTGTSVTWQWFVNKGAGFVPLADDVNFGGSTSKTLTITNAQAGFNNWIFRARTSGICGVPVFTNFAVLRVINPPAVTLQPLPKTICENGNTSFLANGTGYINLHWQVFSGGIWTNLTDDATYMGTGSQQLAIMNAPVTLNGNQYRLALTSACAVTYSNGAVLKINANPVVDFSAVDPIHACGSLPLILNGNPAGGSGTYLQHRWTGDVGPLNSYTVQSPTFSSLISGSYNLNYKVTDSNSCSANDDVTVLVDSPSAQFDIDVSFGCTPLQVSFTKDTAGLSKWWWNFGDGSPVDSVNANPVHTFNNNLAGSIEFYPVRLIVQSPGGCLAQYTSTITVYPEIDATFTAGAAVICSGNSVSFTATSGASRYFWDYGDGVSGYGSFVTSHLYTNLTTSPSVITVRLTTTSFYNCTDVKTINITIMPVPVPQFSAVPVTQVFNVAGNQVTFTNATNPGTWSWLWKFGDNTTSTDINPVHNFNNVGTYPVTLIASNANCADSVSHNIYVIPPAPVAGFDTVPSGCAPLFVNINNSSLNSDVPGTTFKWDFGDGSTSTAKNPTYTYFTAGTYRIELMVSGPGGTSVKSQVVSAYPSPRAYFEITPNLVYANDERVRCFNLSQGADSFLWEFGDGDTSKVMEPFHKYMEEGVYDITLWAYSANGCSDKYILSPAVTVEPIGELRFASVFTPNKTGPIERSDLPTGGNEVDQFFYPPIRQKVLKYKLQIFNRLGVLIFLSDNINIPWNGYYKGTLCQQGVYVWYVEGKYFDGKPFKMVGNVTLLH